MQNHGMKINHAYQATNAVSFEDFEEDCISFNLGELSHTSHISSDCGAVSRNHNSSRQEAEIERLGPNCTEEKNLAFLNTSINNSTGTKQGSTAGECRNHRAGQRSHKNFSPGQRAIRAETGTKKDQSAALMNRCVQNTVDQAKQMHVKGADCQREDPYAALKTETFKKMLKTTGKKPAPSRRTYKGRVGSSGRKKTKFCKAKTDECELTQLQLCPMLGSGHTHEKLISELTPMLLRTAQSLDCQLREICRRLFFMKHNVPQMTAPALVNFHAILAEVTRMLIVDFTTFPTGLKLPGCSKNE